MSNPAKNKKYGKRGVGPEFLIITALVIISIGVIGVVMWKSVKPVYAGTQVEACRISVAAHEGTEGNWPIPSTPRFCSTIYRIKDNEEVPLETYTQDKRGAGKDIREMIADCWYMWHEGRPDVLDDSFTDSNTGCRTCFVFKIGGDEKIKDIDEDPPLDNTFVDDLMHDVKPNSAPITSDECAFENTGGFLIGQDSPNPAFRSLNSCENLHRRIVDTSDKWTETPSEKVVPGQKCCVSSEFPNECENYGGICITSEDAPPVGYTSYKRSCPVKRECYVKDEDYFTYSDYITRQEGGTSLLFVSNKKIPDNDFLKFSLTETLTFAPGEKYAIMFIVPADDLCPGDGSVCGLRKGIGGWVWTERKPALVAVSTFEDAYDLGCIEGIE